MKPEHTKKFHIRTFGCQMNVLDSEKVAGLLAARGWSKADDPAEADFILYNTCSVREKAALRVYSHLRQMQALKRARPRLVLGVMGCVAQQEGQRMIQSIPGLGLVVGTRRLHRIPVYVDQILNGAAGPFVDVDMDSDPLPVEVESVLRESAFRAFVTIMEGCDNYCAYCVVPSTRGRERSRPPEKIVDEVRRLVDGGVVEVMLLGQNVNSYRDPTSRKLDFAALLVEVATIPGLRRLRFTTSHPKDFQPAILDALSEHPVICNQIHLPAQSGASRVLQAMNRRYSRQQYLETIQEIRKSPRRVSLSSDFIVGFPGESELDFQETLSLLEIVRYDSIFSFIYSPRPGTAALRLVDDTAAPVKGERLRILQSLQERIQLENNQLEIGRQCEVLVDGAGREPGQLASRTTENKIVHFQGDPSLLGRFVPVRITGASAHTLRGDRLDEKIPPR